jgi:hypothetical protein
MHIFIVYLFVSFILEKRLTIQQILKHEFFSLGTTPTTIPVSALTIVPCFDIPQLNKPVNSSLFVRQPLKMLLNNNLNTAIPGTRNRTVKLSTIESALKKVIDDKNKNDNKKKSTATSSDQTEPKKQVAKPTARKSLESALKKPIVKNDEKESIGSSSNQKSKSVELKPSVNPEEKLKSELCEGTIISSYS